MPIAVNDVVQIDPDLDSAFGGCFMMVTELKPGWDGLVGFVKVPGQGDAYYRVEEADVRRIGSAEWTLTPEGDTP